MKTSLFSHPTPRPSFSSRRGFTLVDLLAVLAVLAVATLLLTPVLARTQLDSKALRCLNNARQMAAAFQLYLGDNQDFFPPAPDDGATAAGHNWCGGSAGFGDAQEFNRDVLQNSSVTLVAAYLRGDSTAFLCPGDTRQGPYTGTNPALIGKRVNAARTIALNGAVGTICPGFDSGGGHSGIPRLPTNGSWLNNAHTHRRDTVFKTFGKGSSFTLVGPAGIWLTLDEDPYSLNDGLFAFGMNTAEWLDFPGTLHDFGTTFSFADGHAELRRWLDPRTRVVSGNVSCRAVPGSADWQWLAERTSFRLP